MSSRTRWTIAVVLVAVVMFVLPDVAAAQHSPTTDPTWSGGSVRESNFWIDLAGGILIALAQIAAILIYGR